MNTFFIDSANVNFINRICDNVKTHLPLNKVLAGFTTNPKILDREGVTGIFLKDKIRELLDLLESLRGDKEGKVYVQIPYSYMPLDEMTNWILDLFGSMGANPQLGIKLPPDTDIINAAGSLHGKISLNITGVTSWEQVELVENNYILVDYISFLFGRMEALGINAEKQILKSQKYLAAAKLLAGSLRDLNGLERSFDLNMVPTIGTTAWDSVEKEGLDKFISLLDDVPQIAKDLSNSFFEEMDGLAGKNGLAKI